MNPPPRAMAQHTADMWSWAGACHLQREKLRGAPFTGVKLMYEDYMNGCV